MLAILLAAAVARTLGRSSATGEPPLAVTRYAIELEVKYVLASEPEVVYPQGNRISISRGKTLIVKCRARGKPNPKILLIKNGRNLVLTSNVKIDREEVNSQDDAQQQLVSTLRISRILERDSGNYTCRAENNHGSIQKWVFVDVESPKPKPTPLAVTPMPAELRKPACPAQYCLNNGTCSRLSHRSPPMCNCSQPYWGARCERMDPVPFRNYSESCRGKVLDCFHRTDRILTVTGIGLVLTMLLLILLISWYLSRQRRRDFDFWRRSKRENERSQCVQAGSSLQSSRTVGTDVEHDLCIVDSLEQWLPRSLTYPTQQEYAPRCSFGQSAAGEMHQNQYLYQPQPQLQPQPQPQFQHQRQQSPAFIYCPLQPQQQPQHQLTTWSWRGGGGSSGAHYAAASTMPAAAADYCLGEADSVDVGGAVSCVGDEAWPMQRIGCSGGRPTPVDIDEGVVVATNSGAGSGTAASETSQAVRLSACRCRAALSSFGDNVGTESRDETNQSDSAAFF